VADVKFCGMTRDEDVREAARLGASYVGAIMTESARRVAPERARELFAALDGSGVRRVGVFGDEPVAEVIHACRIAGVDVVQWHGAAALESEFERLKRDLGVELWRVVRVGPSGLRRHRSAFDGTDGILLDTFVKGALGGTGSSFDWQSVATDVRVRRVGHRLIVAGGLRPDTVRAAIDQLSPDVVDVSSGVESGPGVKDHQRMADFMAAVRGQ
jgi:phosphoribosylanthranilate isomerase